MLRLFLCGLLMAWTLVGAPQPETAPPYRFLLVVSNQWEDPASYLVEGGGEFGIIVSLLKLWGLPFEILRLDQQRLDKYHLLQRDGTPRYGTIIWDAGPGALEGKGAEVIAWLVRERGVNLVAVGDSVASQEIAGIAGVQYVSAYQHPYGLTFGPEHFITRALKGREPEFGGGYPRGDKVESRGATVLATRGNIPFLTVRQTGGQGRVVWLGANRESAQIGKQIVRDLFKRALVWAQGYALYAEYPRSVLLEMHDMGASDKTFLTYWHYRNLNQKEIEAAIVEPLKKHRAVLNLVVNTGFVDRKTQRVLNPWQQERVVDQLDPSIVHDYASLKRGLDAGIRAGVFEVESHGWTHMLPDLDSAPGPFWSAPLDGTATLGWDNEFEDRIRKREIPAATQRAHMERSLECLREDFNVSPLFIRPGGGAYSPSYPNHTARIAAEMGFGLTRLTSPYYLGHDLVVALGPVISARTWSYERKISAADIPWTVDGPYFLAFHDKDVAMDNSAVERLLAGLGEGVHYFKADEFVAYLHARIGQIGGSALAVDYDDHYCRYFATHDSRWSLHLSDEMRSKSAQGVPEKQVIAIPKGLGRHIVPMGTQ